MMRKISGNIFIIFVSAAFVSLIVSNVLAEPVRVNKLSHISGGAPVGTGSVTTASFTPANNSLLVAIVSYTGNNITTDKSADITIAGGGLTWIRRLNVGTGTGYGQGLAIFTAPVTTGSAMTLTLDCGSNAVWAYGSQVFQYTNYDTSSPVGATATTNNAVEDGAQSLTLSATPASTSEVLGFYASYPNTTVVTTEGSGWTELYDAGTGGSTHLHSQAKVNVGSTTVPWADVAASGMQSAGIAAAIEIKASTGSSPTYTVTPSAGANGSINPSTPQIVSYNQTSSFTIAPGSGYHIGTVSGCNGTLNGSNYTTGPITADCTVSASFAIDTGAPVARVNKLSHISGSAPVGTGSQTTASFTPADNSLLLAIVSYTGNNLTQDKSADITIAGGGLTWTRRLYVGTGTGYGQGLAIFTAPVTTGSAMTLTLDCGSNAVWAYGSQVFQYTNYDTSSPVGATATTNNAVEDGAQSLTLSATPASTSEVLGFYASYPNTTVVTTEGSGWTELYDAGTGGSTHLHSQAKVNVGSTTVPWADVAASGMQSAGIAAAIEIKASTGPPPAYTIAASAGANGSISPSGAVVVSGGTNTTFTMTPNTGYKINTITVDGSSVATNPTYTFSNITANHTISATFSVSTYTITASAGANGSISPSGAVPVAGGANQAFTMTPNTGFSFTSLLVDGATVTAASPYVFNNVTANHTIIATFTDNTPPTGSISINNNATYTNNTSVTLLLSATDSGSGVTQMQFSNDAITWSAVEPYATTKTWSLSAGNGPKTVSVRFKDPAGNWSEVYSAVITLNATAPVVTISSPVSGATYSIMPLISYTASDGMVVVRVDNVPVDKTSGDRLALLPDGSHSILVEATNAAGTGFDALIFNVDTSPPVEPVVTSLSMGDYHALAIKTDGTLWAWGDNEYGQLGDGTVFNRYNPVRTGILIEWQSVSAGGLHSTALTNSGELWAWGYNSYGQLGDGSTVDKPEPVNIPTDPDKFWRVVSAGSNYTMAIRSDGTLWAWGLNDSGQLGDGSITNRSAPVQIGTDNNWVSVSAGSYHTMALKNDGTLWAWGYNAYGQLGIGSTVDSASPLQVGQEKTWIAVTTGYYHTVALKSDSTLWSWGLNDSGQLGDGSTSNQAAPVQIGTDNTWVSISAGGFHTMALKSDGTLWTWGININGQLGDGTTTERNIATSIGSTTGWSAIAAGMMSSAAVATDGAVSTWGDNTFGQLGSGASVNGLAPVRIGADSNWLDASGGLGYSLALKINNTLWAWGDNSYGQLGAGTSSAAATPVQVGTESNWDKIAAGENHALAIKTDGSLWGWGHNNHGQIGDGTTTNRTAPVPITAGAAWFSVSAGKDHSLGIQSNGSLWAWGFNGIGQLGDGTTTDSVVPVNIGMGATWTAVAAGQRSSYAIRSDGTLWAWGAGDDGQLGNGSWVMNSLPVPVDPLTSSWEAISAGALHVLAIDEGVFCAWGKNDHGQLTNGWSYQASNQNEPMCPEGTWDWVQMAAGQDFSLGRKLDGTVWSWGNNVYGQLGDGTTMERHYPAQIGEARDWALIAAGKQHALAIKTDGTLWSWGYNSRGQTGTGDLGIVQQPETMQFSGAILINNDARLTNNKIVTLALSMVEPDSIVKMQFSNDNLSWSTPDIFATSMIWDVNNATYGGIATDGSKIVYARVQDIAGNWSEVASATITLDSARPTVIITSPVDGVMYDTLPVLTYTVSEGLAEVGVGPVDPRYEAIPSGSPLHRYAYGIDGWIHVSVRATDAAGNVGSASVKFKVALWSGDPIEDNPNCNGTEKYLAGPSNFTSGIIVPQAGSGAVNIASPENYATINGSMVIVKGAMDTAVPIKSVMVVVSSPTGTNNYTAQVNGKYFAAKIPVASDVTIAVIATDQTGTQHKDSVLVYVNTQQDPVTLLANPSTGITAVHSNGNAILDVSLETTMSLSEVVDSYAWDFSGTDYNDLTCWSHSNIMARYQQPGLYVTQVEVRTSDHRYGDSVIVNVLDVNEIDGILKPIWTGMKTKLGNQDIEGAIGLFTAESQNRYREIFTALSSVLPAIIQNMQDIQLVYANENIAKYRIRKNELYGGQMMTITYYIYFMKDSNGTWSIDKF